MTEKNYKNEIEKLESELVLKRDEIKKYLDKIDYLEETIMEIEANLTEKNEEANLSIIKSQLNHLEKYNRELKDKMGFLRLENVRLKQELENCKKGHYENISLIKIAETKSSSTKSENSMHSDLTETNSETVKEEFFNIVELKCPICEKQKILKIPINFVNPSLTLTTISIPKDIVCEHSFQILIDKSFKVRKIQIENFELNKIELSNNEHINSKLFSGIRTFIDDREILGVILLDDEWNTIFASFPSDSMLDLFKEIHFRKERQIRDIIKIYFEMKNQQKVFLEYIEILGLNHILVLIFSQKVNFGMGTMLFKDIKEKLQKSVINYKDGII